MKYAVIYSSSTGNTAMLANAIHTILPSDDCIYDGELKKFPETGADIMNADRIYVGFWTDKGSCTPDIADFLQTIHGKEIFLFGTAGFGGQAAYFQKILDRVSEHIDESNQIIGSYMCQGKMPVSVRQRYEKMLESPDHSPNIQTMIDNFDKALSHPDQNDCEAFKTVVKNK